MVVNLVRKRGVSALGYSGNDASVPWRCSLKILHSDSQFVVSLEGSISIHGVNDEQLFTLRYEGDNLMPNKNSLRPPDIPFSADVLDGIAQQGQPRVRMLSLTLKIPCSLWYPRSIGKTVSSHHPHFYALLTLARATEVRILFDLNSLRPNNYAQLQSVLEGSRQLTGVPVIAEFTHLYQQADWSNLNFFQNTKSRAYLPIEDVASEAVPSIEDAIHDAPPSYSCAHVSSKRSRTARTSLTPDSPLPKRLLQDPTCAPLPTERATSVSSLSAKSTASSTATAPVDIFQEAVTIAVEKALPGVLRNQLPGILREQLSGILQDLLPGMLASPSPSPSLSPTPSSRQTANALTQHCRIPSHKPTPAAVFRTVIRAHAETHLQRVFTDTLDRASDQAYQIYNSASGEFEDILGDTRLEFARLKEDHIAAFDHDCNETFVEFKEHLVQEKDEVEAHAGEVVLKAWDRLNIVEKDARCRCKCLHGAKDKQGELERGRRAMSLPL